MTTMPRVHRAFLVAAALSGAAWCAGDIPTASNPLVAPLFSLEQGSPSVPLPFRAADVLQVPGPTIAVIAANLRLNNLLDDLDAISFANSSILTAALPTQFVLTFSVDADSVGLVPPDPGLAAQGFLFNVQDQASKGHAAGDEFMCLTTFTRNGPTFLRDGSTRAIFPNNVLVRDEGDAGGIDYDILPFGVSVLENNPGLPLDLLDAGARDMDAPAPLRLNKPLYFSASSGSPSLGLLPPPASGATIYVDMNTNAPGGELVYVAPATIGLQIADDIGALEVFDNGNHTFQAGIDQVLFTLKPGSPTLIIFGLSPADVLSSRGFNTFNLFAPAQWLGLTLTDHVDFLALARCNDIDVCIQDWGIRIRCPGDGDYSGRVDQDDLDAVLFNFGSNQPQGTNGDWDGDGDVDDNDLDLVLFNFGVICPP